MRFASVEHAGWPPVRLLTPVFVTYSTNVGEGLLKPNHMPWHTWTLGGHVEEWHIPSIAI